MEQEPTEHPEDSGGGHAGGGGRSSDRARRAEGVGDNVTGDNVADGLGSPRTDDEPGARHGWRAPAGVNADHGPGRWGRGAARTGDLEPGVGAVASALAALEPPSEVDDECLAERTVDLVRLRSLLEGAIAGHVREWDRRCMWAEDGSKSPTARMARDANCSRPAAGASVKLSRALARMPLTDAALATGIISTDHARRLAQACTDERLPRFLELEAQLLTEAVRLAGDYQGFCTVVAYFESVTDDDLHDPTDPDDEPPGAKRRRLERDFRVSQVGDGWDLRGLLGTGDGAIVANQLRIIYDQLWEADWAKARAEHGDAATEADLGRTVGQRRADALAEMAKRSSGYRTGDQIARPLVTVIVNEAEFTGPIRETFNGIVLSRRDVAEWLTQADFERIVFDPTGKPVDVTSPRRFFTGAMRRAVQIRDRQCAHPTCNVDAERCQVDHVIEHSAGGPTNIDNARLLCPRHNQQRPGRGKKPDVNGGSRDRGNGDGGEGDEDGDGGDGEGDTRQRHRGGDGDRDRRGSTDR